MKLFSAHIVTCSHCYKMKVDDKNKLGGNSLIGSRQIDQLLIDDISLEFLSKLLSQFIWSICVHISNPVIAAHCASTAPFPAPPSASFSSSLHVVVVYSRFLSICFLLCFLSICFRRRRHFSHTTRFTFLFVCCASW